MSDSNQIITKDQWTGTGGITTQYEDNTAAFRQTHYANGAKIGGSRSRHLRRRSSSRKRHSRKLLRRRLSRRRK